MSHPIENTMKHTRILLICVATALATSAPAEVISGAGSSAAAPIYKTWAAEYQKVSGNILNYDAVGSSAGVKKIGAREVDFGASDVAPPESELGKLGLVVFPIAITGIVPVVNLPKISDGQLRMSGDVLARIYLGEIAQWNAPPIAQLNPNLSLPDLPIRVIARSDGSGTTFNFTDYLSKVNATWKSGNGTKSTIAWPGNFVAVKGSDGVVKAVKETVGGIGYVDYGYVKENRLVGIQMRNSDNEFVTAGVGTFRAALQASEWSGKGTFNSTLTNQPGKSSWPITMGTFALVPQVTDKPEQTQRALKFFVWAFTSGDALVQSQNFVRLPDRVQAAAFKSITSVRDKSGNLIGLGLYGGTSRPSP
jgi:phosphate transport system substrate-binding protein